MVFFTTQPQLSFLKGFPNVAQLQFVVLSQKVLECCHVCSIFIAHHQLLWLSYIEAPLKGETCKVLILDLQNKKQLTIFLVPIFIY